MTGESSTSLAELARTPWDAIIIGAGPAGAVSAHQLALRNLRTLLVDTRHFPRYKVCGGCLNERAVDLLRGIGLDGVLEASHARPINQLRLRVGQRETHLALPPGWAISREVFDLEMVHAAERAGATFVDGTHAVVEPKIDRSLRLVAVARNGMREILQARVVVCADGLTRSSLRQLPGMMSTVAANSRIGVGATITSATAVGHDDIAMTVGRHGYVGIAYCGRGRLNIAAAINPLRVARQSVRAVVIETLTSTNGALPELATARWHGTPALTSKPSRVAHERVFVVGDAGGYVEPFSGEGMAAAMESAVAAAPLVARAALDWKPLLAEQWQQLHRRLVYDRQTTCRQLAWIWRRPWAARTAMTICRAAPRVANRFIARLS